MRKGGNGDITIPRGLRELTQDELAKYLHRDLELAREKEAKNKPALIIERRNLSKTAYELGKLLANHPDLYDYGGPARLCDDHLEKLKIVRLDAPMVIHAAHDVCCPAIVSKNRDGEPFLRFVTLPDRIASLYLALRGRWQLRPLRAITATPAINANGDLGPQSGYDSTARIFVMDCPKLNVPDRPSREDALKALQTIRRLIRTFAFADASLAPDGFVDLSKPPGVDETAAINGIVTAVCRPSVDRAPALALISSQFSGSGVGKGLLASVTFYLALGRSVGATTGGHDDVELEKRIVTALLECQSGILLDNVNKSTLRSNTLASALTESPIRIRTFGRTETILIDASPIVIVTGNGLSISEDLARRFLVCRLDARCENPEQRVFPNDVRAEVMAQRHIYLNAIFSIVRWGLQCGDALPRGKPLGSFEQWCRMVRDPLLALGCGDPVDRINEIKEVDPRRRAVIDLFVAWREAHGSRPIKASELAEPVRAIIDPQNRGRQFVARALSELTGTRLGGVVLTAVRNAGRYAPTTYALLPAEDETERPSKLDPL